MTRILRIGTRGSPLALVQAEEVRARLLKAHSSLKPEDIALVPIRTGGDWKPEDRERRFIELGGTKELFTKEIEEALLGGSIDMAVHSMKDVSSFLPEGLDIAAILPRADPRDAFVSARAASLDDLPPGATIGTASLRRQAQILARRPDLQVTPLRGNVETRLQKLADGMADATILAVAGMERLGLHGHIASVMTADIMLPAAGQGAIGVEIRQDDKPVRDLLTPLNDSAAMLCVRAERALLRLLDGSCKTPIGALARIGADGTMMLEGLLAEPDGSNLIRRTLNGPANEPETLGASLGQKIRGAC